MAVRALLLDFDGTLADSLPALHRVYKKFVRSLGGQPTNEEFESLNGPPLREVVGRLCVAHQRRPLCPRDLDEYYQLIADEMALVAPATGAIALVDAARSRGIRCAIVTSNRAGLVEPWLKLAGLSVDGLVAGDDTKEGKPSPAPYCLALKRIGVDAAHALAIEDSVAGVRSATAAGIRTLRLASASVDPGNEVAVIASLADALPYLNPRFEG